MKSRNILSKLLLFSAVAASVATQAEIQKQLLEYKDGDTVLEGYLVYDDAWTSKRPAVVVVHQWKGLSDHEKTSAERLAALGYVAFAADIYGKGVRPADSADAGKLAGSFKSDVKLFRRREKAAFDLVAENPRVDAKNIVFMGYCFGGTGALEAARAGLPVRGVVSFHGGLASATPADARKIKGKVLVLHGAIDPNVPPTEVAAFQKEMNDAKVDYQFVAYSGAVHSFTQKSAGNDISKGSAYNENADRRSWNALEAFLKEVAPL